MFPDTPGWPLVLALYVGSALYWSITRLQISLSLGGILKNDLIHVRKDFILFVLGQKRRVYVKHTAYY